MDFLNSVDLNQLVTAAGFIAFLIWQLTVKEKRISDLENKVENWQNRTFENQRDSQKQIYDAISMLDKLGSAISGN